MTAATIALANNQAASAVTTTVRAGLFAADPATQAPASLANGQLAPPIVETTPLAVTVPLCASPCAPPAPAPATKPVFTLALGSAASPAWTVTPGIPFAFGLASPYPGASTDIKWANVDNGAGTDAAVVGASSFVVSPTTWATVSGAWVSGLANNNQLTLEYACFGGC